MPSIVFDLSLKLKLERTKRRLSQSEVAEAIGLKKSTISQYETGQTSPPAINLAKLAVFYDVSTDYLLGIDNKQTVVLDGLDQEQIDALQHLIFTMKSKPQEDKTTAER